MNRRRQVAGVEGRHVGLEALREDRVALADQSRAGRGEADHVLSTRVGCGLDRHPSGPDGELDLSADGALRDSEAIDDGLLAKMSSVVRDIAEWSLFSAAITAVRYLFGNGTIPDGPLPLAHPIVATVVWSLVLIAVFSVLAARRYAKRD